MEHPTVTLLRSFVARLEARDWAAVAEVLHPDVVYRLPQSGEVVRGRDAYVRWNQEYPDVWHLRIVDAYGDDSGGALRLDVADEREAAVIPALVFVHVIDGMLGEITDYWPTPYDPPPGRGHLTTPEA